MESVNTVDTDILIVGAGPVGLLLANECARRGLKWRLIEKKATLSEHSKALAIFPRTMEIFDMAGIVDPFVEAAHQVTSAEVIANGRTLAHLPFTPETTPYPYIAMVPQNVTERLLAEQLLEKSGTIEYGTSFVSAVDDDDFVNVMIEHENHESKLTAAYVVGCDGAHSAVRHQLQTPFEGGEYHELFMLADVETNEALPADQLQLCPHKDGPLAIFPMSATRRRIVAMVPEPQGDAPSLELVRDILQNRAPAGIKAHDLHWSSYFHIHHRNVSQLQFGRIFLAGDAAHIHSPFGGQGMNTGLHDVWNLTWKLDLVLRGHGSDELLNSYTEERLPVIKHVVGMTDFLTRAMATPNKVAQAMRNAIIPMVSHLTPFQHVFVQQLSELGIHYHASPIVEGPGKRCTDDSIRGGKGLLHRYLLMSGADLDADFTLAASQLAEAYSEIVELRTCPGKGLSLVRPDGYLGYSANHVHGITVLGQIQNLLKKQIR